MCIELYRQKQIFSLSYYGQTERRQTADSERWGWMKTVTISWSIFPVSNWKQGSDILASWNNHIFRRVRGRKMEGLSESRKGWKQKDKHRTVVWGHAFWAQWQMQGKRYGEHIKHQDAIGKAEELYSDPVSKNEPAETLKKLLVAEAMPRHNFAEGLS